MFEEFLSSPGTQLFSEEESGSELGVRHCCLLLEHLLQCLSRCFLYDKTEFTSRDRFEALLLPLVNQVGLLDSWMGGAWCISLGGLLLLS